MAKYFDHLCSIAIANGFLNWNSSRRAKGCLVPRLPTAFTPTLSFHGESIKSLSEAVSYLVLEVVCDWLSKVNNDTRIKNKTIQLPY